MKYTNDGLPIRSMIPRKDAKTAAIAWSEGRKSLQDVLEMCIER